MKLFNAYSKAMSRKSGLPVMKSMASEDENGTRLFMLAIDIGSSSVRCSAYEWVTALDIFAFWVAVVPMLFSYVLRSPHVVPNRRMAAESGEASAASSCHGRYHVRTA